MRCGFDESLLYGLSAPTSKSGSLGTRASVSILEVLRLRSHKTRNRYQRSIPTNVPGLPIVPDLHWWEFYHVLDQLALITSCINYKSDKTSNKRSWNHCQYNEPIWKGRSLSFQVWTWKPIVAHSKIPVTGQRGDKGGAGGRESEFYYLLGLLLATPQE